MLKSTRSDILVSSMEAILNGLAPDGGLYVMDKLPSVDYHSLFDMDYPKMASKIISLFFKELDYNDILKEVQEAYSSFDSSNVVEIRKCKELYFLELFHGPTLAFKDLALVVLPRLMKLSREKLGYDKKITILTATSGDTGGAALNGFKGVDGINIIVLYPNGGVSEVQEAQMHSFDADNSRVIAVEGNFDDCQSFVKSFFKKHKELSLSSANSINIGRLIPQVVYYFYTYIYMVKNKYINDLDKISFSVPTGNFGNIFAGIYAKMMGLPINKLICASNKNDVLTDYFNSGIYNKNREFYKTNSPSMDILISSNLERLIYYANGQNPNKTKELMDELMRNGKYKLDNPFSFIHAYSANEDETLKMIRKCYYENKYLIDPHTAVAYKGALDYLAFNDDIVVAISTASPFKFPDAIMEAFSLGSSDKLKCISDYFNLEIPSVLNYKGFKRKVVAKDKLDATIVEVIKCLE